MNERNIKYLDKDFNSFREELIELARNYFSDTYSDFSVSSPGMMFIEMASYVGDVLSFYQDAQIQETFLQYARNPKNLYAIAYMMGYRPKVTTTSEVELTLVLPVSTTSDGQPDWEEASAAYIPEHSVALSENGVKFLTEKPVDFTFSSSYDPTEIEYVDNNTVNLVKKVKAFSGEIKTIDFEFKEYEKFKTVTIEDSNIVGILDCVDKDNAEIWTEVPFLGQDTVFKRKPNESEDSNLVKYVLETVKVPRRFVTRFNSTGGLEIQFGAGVNASDIEEKNYLPDPISLTPTVNEQIANGYDIAYDPSNFLFSKSYGVAPINRTLTFRYIVGGGLQSNVPAGSINTLEGFDDLNISVLNEEPACGGRSGDSLEEIRQNSLRSFAEQKRVVTLEDYNVRALAMPSEFGVISKVYAANNTFFRKDNSSLSENPLGIDLYVLTENSQGHMDYASDTLKENLRKYIAEYMLITDTVNIRDAFIVNLGVSYEVSIKSGYRGGDIILKANQAIKDFLDIKKRSINQPIYLSELRTVIDNIPGVQTVKNIFISNLTGDGYSSLRYDVKAAIQNDILYPSYDPCIFEIRYPDIDIKGRIVSL